jgi:hypothetical protein
MSRPLEDQKKKIIEILKALKGIERVLQELLKSLE